MLMAETENVELLKKYNQLYLEIIMKYREYIEEKENLYVVELPKLVMPQDERVAAFVAKLKSTFPIYTHDENFYDAAKLAHEHVKQNVTSISLPIQFWVEPDAALNIGAGDLFDKAILLCSLLIALGNVTTKVMVASTSSYRKFTVYFEHKDKLVAMDVEDGMNEYPNKEALLKKLSENKDEELAVYEFNDKVYNNLV